MKWRRLYWGFAVYILAWFWNKFLFPFGGFYADWIGYTFSIGDCLYILSYSMILSLVWRSNEKI